MILQILVDNKNSWIIPFAEKLNIVFKSLNHSCELIFDHSDLKSGDVLFLLSCEKLISKDLMSLHKHNLVVHESALPQGKGWSPLTWQVLEGKKKIPITLFEAQSSVDSGDIYLQDHIELTGTELIDELRELQGSKTIELALLFVKNFHQIKSIKQQGESSFYKKRTPIDSKLDLNLTLQEQFNLLRVCDNDRYPAWFEVNGEKFVIKIYKEEKI